MIREIEPAMVAYIDKKLAQNGLAQYAIETKDARTLMVLAAESLVGITEKTGRNDGKMIRLIQETVGGAVGEPYCIAGIQTCIAYAEHKTGCKSPLMATEHAQTLYRKTPKKYHVKRIPLPGAIAIWGDVGKHTGHGEIVRSADLPTFLAVGFNTTGTRTPGEKVRREGNGVFFTTRTTKSTGRRAFLGFVKPF